MNREHRPPTVDHIERECAARARLRHPLALRTWAAIAALASALLVCALSAERAHAQESAQVLASRALFEEGRRLMTEGRFAEACVKLEESQSLRSGIGTQFNLAECYEKMGRSASAWSLYLRVASETKALGQAEREQVARTRASALEARLPRLTIEVAAPTPGLAIELDGTQMTAATWGIATPLDPGDHELVARAPGYQDWKGIAHVREADPSTKISVPALLPAAPEAAQSAAATPPAPAAPDARNDEGVAEENKTVPYVIGGVGAASVVLGALFGLNFLDKNGEAKKVCAERPTDCPRTERERHAELTQAARRARTAGFVTFGLGLLGVGISAYWLLGDDAAEPAATLGVAPVLGDSEAGASLYGTF